ncbi:hypothetical protein [Nocardia transvalensis]|uniref:hypothetical protein n=1 Tax=Nocardia transvalensis TaxID=37333 RepID=UPI001893CABD|nr:hypothetical protein [Nocardia transvalensis]MBF6330773.1 hypothetical protein [Nocardia transvalensis]
MSEEGGWEDFVVDLCDLAVKYDADTFLSESRVVLSARTIHPGDQCGSIVVTRFDDEAARVETGWCFTMVVDYVAEDHDRPVPALGLIEAICSGNAEEHCLIDSDGRWVGILLEAWAPNGDRWQSGDPNRAEKRATRRFPRWAQ